MEGMGRKERRGRVGEERPGAAEERGGDRKGRGDLVQQRRGPAYSAC